MTYAAQLIDAVKKARGFKTYREVAAALDVTEQALNAWKKGRGSPMPEERARELCAMAHIADVGPWLVGIHADGLSAANKPAWESVLDRVRPAVATVGTIAVALLVVSALPSSQQDDAVSAFAFLNAIPLIHYAQLAMAVTAGVVCLRIHARRPRHDRAPAMLA